MSSKSIPEPWNSFLVDLDAALTDDVELHSLGGFVITIFPEFNFNSAELNLMILSIALLSLLRRPSLRQFSF
jgi:hypothetical protein